jgi:uncharacterized protein (TIGR03546 family)
MIKSVLNLIGSLQSNSSPGEIAAGVVLGLFIGLTPMSGTHLLIFGLLFFFLKIQKGATVLSVPLFKLAYLLGFSGVLDSIGYYLLVDVSALRPFFAWAVQAPVLAYLNLNQTLVLGGCVVALALSIPAYLTVTAGVGAYRSYFHSNVEKWGIVRWLKGLSFIKWIATWWPSNHE